MSDTLNVDASRNHRIPMWIKIAFTAFMAVLVPVYSYRWGPTNFLWFCDVALVVTLIGIWRESPRLIGMQAVAIVLPQMLWIVDFLGRIVAGTHVIGITEYMFDPANDLFARFLSLFHFWLPLLLIYLVWRVGFDRKAVGSQSVLCWVVLIATFLILPHTDNKENINKIWGWDDASPQTTMDMELWLACLMLIYPIAIYVPSHFLFSWLAPNAELVTPEQGHSNTEHD